MIASWPSWAVRTVTRISQEHREARRGIAIVIHHTDAQATEFDVSVPTAIPTTPRAFNVDRRMLRSR